MMFPPKAKVEHDYALIDRKEGNDVYSQGYFGQLTKSGNLKLNPYETTLLLERKRIESIDSNNNTLSLSQLVAHYSNIVPNFLIQYLLYKELRGRGYVVKTYPSDGSYFELYERGSSPKKVKHLALVVPMIEGKLFNIDDIDQIVNEASKLDRKLIFAVIDSLGDVSYYSVSELEFKEINLINEEN